MKVPTIMKTEASLGNMALAWFISFSFLFLVSCHSELAEGAPLTRDDGSPLLGLYSSSSSRVLSSSSLQSGAVDCAIAGVCVPNWTAAHCTANGGTVGCGNNPPAVDCTIAGVCIPNVTVAQCTANGGTVGCSNNPLNPAGSSSSSLMPSDSLSSSSRAAVAAGSFTDPRDEQSYGTVTIGSQTWMAENLNYNVEGSNCHNDDTASCAYGRLYDWATALQVCPNNWRLPSDDDWNALIKSVGGILMAGRHLKAASSWYGNGNGLDTYGFAALPGGYGFSVNVYSIGDSGAWWSANEESSILASYMGMLCDQENAYLGSNGKSYLLSVRCLQD